MTGRKTIVVREHWPYASWARVVSDVLSPPVVWAAMALLVAFAYSDNAGSALYWAAIYSVFVCLLPILYIAAMVRMGKIGDIHMKEREERYKPLLVSIGCTGLAWWLLRILGAPPVFPLLSMIGFIQICIVALITISWQISMHSMAITGAVIAIGILFSVSTALMLVPSIFLVGAARLNLKRHTPWQVAAGVLVGALVPVLMFMLLPTVFSFIL